MIIVNLKEELSTLVLIQYTVQVKNEKTVMAMVLMWLVWQVEGHMVWLKEQLFIV